ncbi:hypothetical protein QR680_005812 [Steinernema hermaphroditum]|uniref:Protein kinase domain-containing protein n=1 Tax=Steinernema hermaphroditum TaxID=289476 RepID=A0AA39HTE1_9BILA|nr:hypothetical protein QR680_005812 [Steinernema hermaphroditum]
MTSSSEGEILQASQIIRDRWKIKQKVGGGGFGEIYEALDIQNHNERVAIKVESSKATKQVLKMEVAVLRRLQGKVHACKFYGCGRNDKFNYLVMSLQGKNLADLRRESPKQCFSVSTAIRLGFQILGAIREIHSIGFLHRDIKPSNFAMGRTSSNMRNVFMLDFGLARQYLNAKGEIRSPRTAAGFRGTVRYASVTAHKNKEMGRQDDLWSLFYMLVEFLQGSLPWRKIKDKDEVGRMKDEADIGKLLEGCPQELNEFAMHLQTLGYPDLPDYDMLERLLATVLSRMQIKMDDPYDWELGYENLTGRTKGATANGNASTRLRSHTTAMKDRGPAEEKNRALDTQAPITMGEDDDEQTGNCMRFAPVHHDDKHEKPKYKRQEFMRPKYGAVSFDVIDAVNARINAVSSKNELFENMQIETSVHNKDDRNSVEANFEVPSNVVKYTVVGAKNGSLSPQPAARMKNLAQQQSVEKTPKSNRSLTGSTKYTGKQPKSADTNALMDDEIASGTAGKLAPTIVSKWHSSFDESADDDGLAAAGDLPVEKQTVGKRSPLANDNRRGPLRALGTSSSSRQQQALAPSRFPIDSNNSSSPPSAEPRRTTMTTSRSGIPSTTQPSSNVASPSSGVFGSSSRPSATNTTTSSSIMSHFKNLVNTFNNLGTAAGNVRRRSLSRGVSLDDTRTNFSARSPNGNQLNSTGVSTPVSSATTPSSGGGSLGVRKISHPALTSSKVVTSTVANSPTSDEERELRRQRRLRRRSEVTLPQKDSNSTENIQNAVHKTIVINSPTLVDSKVFTVADDGKKAPVGRRKRYQFLNFSPRAASKS